MNILIIADPLDTFKIYKDTTYAIMRAAILRGHSIWACEPKDLFANPLVQTQAKQLSLIDDINLQHPHTPWYTVNMVQTRTLARFDAVLMRKDPPFDTEYFYATHLLSRAEQQGSRIYNSGLSLRDHPEKLGILEFPDLSPATLVSSQALHLKSFIADQKDVILKPLDGMGGTGIFRVKLGDPNITVIIETLTNMGQTTIMAQKYLPDIIQGDKRVLLIGGEAVPFCLARIPQMGETRGNLAAGGRGVAQPLSDSDWRIAKNVANAIQGRGLFLVGLDIIGDKLTEINVTSPTCFVEITQQTGFDVAGMYLDKLLK